MSLLRDQGSSTESARMRGNSDPARLAPPGSWAIPRKGTAMGKRTCSVEGCGEPHRARGYCRPHYLKAIKSGEMTPQAKRRRPPLELFWAKVAKVSPDECWEWTAHRDRNGYGRFTPYLEGQQLAHRWLWTQLHGPIPDGLYICHHCDNPPCVNPAHLFLGTPQDNNQDMIAKGRRVHGYHDVTGENAPMAKLTWDHVSDIRAALAAGEYHRTLAERYGVHPHTIGDIHVGKTWRVEDETVGRLREALERIERLAGPDDRAAYSRSLLEGALAAIKQAAAEALR